MTVRVLVAVYDCCRQIQAVVERNGAKFPVNGFDIPARELGFHGVPDKSMTLLLPCTGCLVSLTSKPVRATLPRAAPRPCHTAQRRWTHVLPRFDVVVAAFRAVS